MNDFIFMNDIRETTRLLNQITDVKTKLKLVLPSHVELRIGENVITAINGYTRLLNAKNMGCIFKFVETHKWKLQTLNHQFCKDQDQFTQILLTTEIKDKTDKTDKTVQTHEAPFYFDVISKKMVGYVVISTDCDNKPIVYVVFAFIDPGLNEGRVENAVVCLLYLQELEKAFELSNDADNQVIAVGNKLGLYFADVLVNIVINYL